MIETPVAQAVGSLRCLVGIVAAALALTACTSPTSAPPEASVIIAPGVNFTLPPPPALGRTVEASQLVTAHYRQQTFVFETHVSVTPARLLAAGFDSLGRRVMMIEWNGTTLKTETAPWVPSGLRAANVVADLMLVHWPAEAVRAGMAQGGELHETATGHRAISAAGRDTILIDRTEGTPPGWSGRWTYQNLGWNYALNIQSSETSP